MPAKWGDLYVLDEIFQGLIRFIQGLNVPADGLAPSGVGHQQEQ